MMSVLLNAGIDVIDSTVIATLGPSGTSSEFAAKHFCEWAKINNFIKKGKITLSKTYELAVEKLFTGEANMLIVANAYQDINAFYMHTGLELSAAFVWETPLYGLATKDSAIPEKLVVASHPAPVPLINELMPFNHDVSKLTLMDSTSAAAKAVAEGKVDVALTTELAVRKYGLKFISNVRTIPMLWSVFKVNYISGSSYQSKDIELIGRKS